MCLFCERFTPSGRLERSAAVKDVAARLPPDHVRKPIFARHDSSIDSTAQGPVGELSRESLKVAGSVRPKPGRLEQSKKINKIIMLWGCSDSPRVLFVQHPAKNARIGAFPSGSFVACARGFGNCGGATEGGIPKSSRLGRSLKSLAFMRVCPKARCDLATG